VHCTEPELGALCLPVTFGRDPGSVIRSWVTSLPLHSSRVGKTVFVSYLWHRSGFNYSTADHFIYKQLEGTVFGNHLWQMSNLKYPLVGPTSLPLHLSKREETVC
jgi:hypothetical protein